MRDKPEIVGLPDPPDWFLVLFDAVGIGFAIGLLLGIYFPFPL